MMREILIAERMGDYRSSSSRKETTDQSTETPYFWWSSTSGAMKDTVPQKVAVGASRIPWEGEVLERPSAEDIRGSYILRGSNHCWIGLDWMKLWPVLVYHFTAVYWVITSPAGPTGLASGHTCIQ